MVARSVFDDMGVRLTTRGWTAPDVPLLEGFPLNIIPAFPDDVQGQGTPMNTLAINGGEMSEAEEEQMGGGLWSQVYTFHLAFYSVSDAAADALFQDLHDEWVEGAIPLFNYVDTTPTKVADMEVQSFEWTQAPDQLSLTERRLHFGRLVLMDWLTELRSA